MTLGTTEADMARAVMEGICYEMRDILEAQKKAGTNIKAIRLTGGGSKSPLWVQMQADIYQQPIHVLQTHETGTLGAALYAGVGAGLYKDYKEAVDIAVHVSKEYTPNSRLGNVYDEGYDRFVHTYKALTAGGVF
jgi:xylulokinase